MNASRDSYVEDNYDQVLEAFKHCGWQAVMDGMSDERYTSISRAFHEAAARAHEDDNQARGKVLRLLAEACSMMLSPENRNDPFDPFLIIGGTRSTISDDFTDAEIRFFHEIIDSMDMPLLKGRLADLVWVRNKSLGVKNALEAIDSYRQLPLDADNWHSDIEKCWQRAIDLSRMIGAAAGDRLGQIETSIIEAIESAKAGDKFFSFRLAKTLRSNGLGESAATAIAEKLESLAGEYWVSGDFHASESFYNSAANWYKLAGEDEKCTDMTVAQAEAYIEWANSRLSSDSPSYQVAASFIEGAIQVLRSISRAHRGRHQIDERLQDLSLRLSEYSRLALDEMATVSLPPIDLSDSIERARAEVSGKSVEDALVTFANLHRVSAKKLRVSAIESLSASLLRALIPKITSSHDGRVIGRTPGIKGATPSEEDELEIQAEMARFHYGPLVSLVVQGVIVPALNILNMEHRLREIDFIELARRSPIVPLGREFLFGKALAYGYNRDFATSIHLLAPQIEHMVRVYLKAAGVNTTHLDQSGIETEIGLSALVDFAETEEIFGEDLTYEIRALFCDQLGPNLRNNIAHGLFDDKQAQSIDSVYAWWFALKLVVNTFWNSFSTEIIKQQQDQEDQEDSI